MANKVKPELSDNLRCITCLKSNYTMSKLGQYTASASFFFFFFFISQSFFIQFIAIIKDHICCLEN